MDSVTHHRVKTCTDDDIWEYELPRPVGEELAECVAPLGSMERPVATAPLYRMETAEAVLLATVGDTRIRLRIKATADATDVKAEFERCLANYLADTDE